MAGVIREISASSKRTWTVAAERQDTVTNRPKVIEKENRGWKRGIMKKACRLKPRAASRFPEKRSFFWATSPQTESFASLSDKWDLDNNCQDSNLSSTSTVNDKGNDGGIGPEYLKRNVLHRKGSRLGRFPLHCICMIQIQDKEGWWRFSKIHWHLLPKYRLRHPIGSEEQTALLRR